MRRKKKKIAILGGGVGGLTVAHQLLKSGENYDITIYECNKQVGGLARSGRDKSGCAIEYCWRVFFGFYHNLLPLLHEIPLKDKNQKKNEKKKVVTDNLIRYANVTFDDTKSMMDTIKNGYNILYGLTSSDARIDKLDDLSWWASLSGTSDVSVLRQVGPWLGMDRYKASYKSVIKVGMEMQLYRAALCGQKDFVTSLPTSEAWFDHWVHFLRGQGVKIHLSHFVTRLVFGAHGEINRVWITTPENRLISIEADEYVCALPVQVVARLIEQSNKGAELMTVPYFSNLRILGETCLHLQVAFQVFFSKPMLFGPGSEDGNEENSVILVKSPWDLIILRMDIYDQDGHTKLCFQDTKAKGGWSIACCTGYTPGLIYKKPFRSCTFSEIRQEIWAQIVNSTTFLDQLEKVNGFPLTSDLITHWSPLWETFDWNEQGQIYTTEPKFTNNAGSGSIRPSFRSPIRNMWISTAYIHETIDIFSMEAACIAGKRVAAAIIGNAKAEEPKILPRPWLMAPFRFVDRALFAMHLPNIGPILFLLVAALVVVAVVLGVIL